MQDNEFIEEIIESIERSAPEIITRKLLVEMLGGAISEKTLANLDSIGRGISPRFTVGRRVGYSKDAAINWVRSRIRKVA